MYDEGRWRRRGSEVGAVTVSHRVILLSLPARRETNEEEEELWCEGNKYRHVH